MNRPLFCATALAALCAAATSFAGQPVSDGKATVSGKKTVVEPCPPDARWLVNLRSSYTAESDFQRGDDASGDSLFNQLEIEHRIPLGGIGWPNVECGAWYLRLGGNYTRWDFSHDGGHPLPNHLQSISATIAVEYLVRGRTAILLETEPGFYFENDIDGDTFDAPTKLAVPWQLTDNFTIVGGVAYSSMRSYPFLPIVGFVWTINDQWEVYAIPPDPKIIYTASEKWKFWLGGELAGGSFRTDDHDFKKKPALNNAVVSYSEWRASVGFTYAMDKAEIDLGVGYAFERKFDFHRAEEGFETDEGAPFVKFEFRAAF